MPHKPPADNPSCGIFRGYRHILLVKQGAEMAFLIEKVAEPWNKGSENLIPQMVCIIKQSEIYFLHHL